MAKTETNTTKAARMMGKIGGQKTKENMGPDHFKNIGKLGAKKRWGKNVKKTLDK